MRIAVVRFPGSNCDQDAFHSLNEDMGYTAEYVWHESDSLAGFDGVVLPGGFSYGDYLRCGAMASRAPIMAEVKRFATEGKPVLGVCNGFQVLCESGLLPGALLLNEKQKFLCQDVYLRAENQESLWTRGIGQVLRIPIAHGEGRYVCDQETLEKLNALNLVAFRYVHPDGSRNEAFNPNGSMDAIAGVLNEAGNVLGLMPHPERYTRKTLGGEDGKLILRAFGRVAANV